jgi:N-acetylglucosamine-6-phosphate deacetylase
MYISHATIYTPEQCIEEGAVLIDGPWIVEVGPADDLVCPDGAERLDASGLLLVPGFIDLQVNGALGYDFTADPGSISHAARLLPRYGVASFLPTIITSPLQIVAEAQEAFRELGNAQAEGATALGLHAEGPFLNPEKKGAHYKPYLRLPDSSAIHDWSPETGVRLVTLAPELPGALGLIASLAERGVVVSAGHSVATWVQARSGIEAGIRYGTHIFNGMAPLHHREPGVVGALMSDPRTVVGLICDGVHTHPAIVQLVWQALGARRLNLVSDAAPMLGMPPGLYRQGSDRVQVDSTGVRLGDGTLAGSVVALDQALRNLISFTGCRLEEALPTVTTTPASVLGLGAERGSVKPGKVADLVLLDNNLVVHSTLVSGKIVFRPTGHSRAS